MLPRRMKLTTTIQILLQEESRPASFGGAGREKTQRQPGSPPRRIEHREEGTDHQTMRHPMAMMKGNTHMNPATIELRNALSRNLPGWARNDAVTELALDFLAFYAGAWRECMDNDCAPTKTRRAPNAVERDVLADRAMRAMEIITQRLRTPPQKSDSIEDLI